jgi:hypothetical protein
MTWFSLMMVASDGSRSAATLNRAETRSSNSSALQGSYRFTVQSAFESEFGSLCLQAGI